MFASQSTLISVSTPPTPSSTRETKRKKWKPVSRAIDHKIVRLVKCVGLEKNSAQLRFKLTAEQSNVKKTLYGCSASHREKTRFKCSIKARRARRYTQHIQLCPPMTVWPLTTQNAHHPPPAQTKQQGSSSSTVDIMRPERLTRAVLHTSPRT